MKMDKRMLTWCFLARLDSAGVTVQSFIHELQLLCPVNSNRKPGQFAKGFLKIDDSCLLKPVEKAFESNGIDAVGLWPNKEFITDKDRWGAGIAGV